MNKQELINRYNNRHIDFDKAYGMQCFDVARQYFQDEGVKTYAGVGKAKNIWIKRNDFFRESIKYVDFIKNNPLNFPAVGDVIVWDSSQFNPFGHVAVVIEANTFNFTVLEQDGFRNQDPTKIKRYPN